MKNFQVTVVRYGSFNVEASNKKEAINLAGKRLSNDLDFSPQINWYDDADIVNIELALD